MFHKVIEFFSDRSDRKILNQHKRSGLYERYPQLTQTRECLSYDQIISAQGLKIVVETLSEAVAKFKQSIDTKTTSIGSPVKEFLIKEIEIFQSIIDRSNKDMPVLKNFGESFEDYVQRAIGREDSLSWIHEIKECSYKLIDAFYKASEAITGLTEFIKEKFIEARTEAFSTAEIENWFEDNPEDKILWCDCDRISTELSSSIIAYVRAISNHPKQLQIFRL